MKGLLITDKLHWHDAWSVRMGQTLKIEDSSNNLFIFPENLPAQALKTTLADIPEERYRLMDLEPARDEDCDFMADSGRCYRKVG